ncbi:MAG: hypothetical protein JST54_17050 [Deltaproteobacteria bacterium]|nr:hypothetical protein [Deltaproteobacteria bacterium]
MKLAVPVLAALALSFAAGSAQAQESHRFNAKTLAAKYSLPVYTAKGAKPVNDEVIEATNDVEHENSAVYVLKGEPKKAVEFYTKEMGAPQNEQSDTGTEKWIFKKDEPNSSKLRHRVIISYDHIQKIVQITLWQREYESAADADN